MNDPPVADDETLTTDEDMPGNVDVLVGDTDIDGGTLVVTAHTAPAHGSVTCTAAGLCAYTPSSNYNGPDSFVYTVTDGNGGTDTGHRLDHGHAGERRPDAVDDACTTREDTVRT